MQRIIILGNSGSGKTTLARSLQEEFKLTRLDLDSLAWEKSSPPKRKPVSKSAIDINKFVSNNTDWVIEGCYADLIELVTPHATEMIFLNPDVDTCVNNCKSRPWEPHKYKTKTEQDANLEILIKWVKQYNSRNDEFSLLAHQKVFSSFDGKKAEYCSQDK